MKLLTTTRIEEWETAYELALLKDGLDTTFQSYVKAKDAINVKYGKLGEKNKKEKVFEKEQLTYEQAESKSMEMEELLNKKIEMTLPKIPESVFKALLKNPKKKEDEKQDPQNKDYFFTPYDIGAYIQLGLIEKKK